jgi:hypothetical protein
MPRDSQQVWGNFNTALYYLTNSILLVQQAEQHQEDRTLYNQTVANAEMIDDKFFAVAVGDLHIWLNALNERIDQMAKTI